MPAKSKQQQKFMGIVKAIQQGDEPASKFSKSAQDAAEDMKEKDVEDFASTKHKGLPKKVEQYLRQKIRKSVEEMIKEDWFDRLSSDDQKKYVKSHPGSKKAKQAAHDKEREAKAKKIRRKGYTIDGDGNIVKVKKQDPKKQAKHVAAIKKGYMPGDDNYEKFVKEDYVETCGYTQSVDGKKLKTPGATGEEDRHLKEAKGFPNKMRAGFIKLKNKKYLSQEESKELHRVYKDITELLTYGKFYDNKKPNKRRYELSALVADINIALIGKKRLGRYQSRFESIFKKFANMINTQFKREEKGLKADYIKAIRASQLDLVRGLFINATDVSTRYQSGMFKESVNEALTGGDRKVLMVIGREIKDNILKKHPNVKGQQLMKVISNVFMSMSFTPDNINYKNFKKYFPKRYNNKLVKRLGDRLESENDRVRQTFFKKVVGESVSVEEERDYKEEYKKYGSSTKAKKYRAELNQYNRKNGTYGNGDGKDASHKGGKIVGFEKESTNRGRAEKSRLKKESVNEGMTSSQGKEVLTQLGGNKFIAMTGAKNFGTDGKSLTFKVGRNSKSVNYVRIKLSSMDLYDMEFLQVRAGKIKIKSKAKRVYADQLGKMFKKHTGMNVRL